VAYYVLRRIINAFVILLLVSLIVFLLLELAPGDPAAMQLGHTATKEGVAQLRAELGLDRPLHQRYLSFLVDTLKGNLGRSYANRRPVIAEIRYAFPATLELSVVSLIIAIIIGVPLGITSAVHQNSLTDKVIRFSVILDISIPIFWLGMMLILVFSVIFALLPSYGRTEWYSIILPAVSMCGYPLGFIIRMTRSSMLEVLRNEYITAARAKGIPERLVIYKHALRNALIPVVTIVGLMFGTLMGGAVLTETVFAWPGIGRLMVQAIFSRDYPIIRAGILLSSATFILINLVVDIAYTYINPAVVIYKKDKTSS